MTREQIVTEALQWLNVRWQHQAGLKGVACDCIGLVRGVYAEITGFTITDIIDYPQTAFYYCRDEKLYPELQKYLVEIPISNALPGDILTFALKETFPDHHLGILVNDGFFVHACGDIGVKKVVQTRLDDRWRGNIRHAFKFPEVID